MTDGAQRWIVTGAIAAALGVILGAFGAHGLEERVSTDLLTVFETGVRYHMYHAFGLLAVGLVGLHRARGALRIAGWCFAIGIVVFSGSLYTMTFTGARWLGAITPIGGVAFIVGWLALAAAARPGD